AGAEKKVLVPATRVTVASILGEGDSTVLSDIKPPAEIPVPWPWRTIGLLAFFAAGLAAALYGTARWFTRPRPAPPRPEDLLPPGVTPDVWARGELARILASGLREAGRHRELHIELADVVRRYVELRFRIPALERTTSEIGEEMRMAL